MTPQEQIRARLAEFFVVYKEIGELLKELTLLQQADVAQAEYIGQTSRLDGELRALTEKQRQLTAAQKKSPTMDAGVRSFRGSPRSTTVTDPNRFKPREIARPTIVRQQPLQSARTDLKKLVGRWGRVWKLSGETQGRINRIADDPARPLGEALALLDWTTFENPIGSSEDAGAHLARIDSWGAALIEYRERLWGELDMLKTKYRLVLPILEIWLNRNADGGRATWEQQIAETNAAKEKEVERLKLEIARLNAGN
jgi:hypothetical protein